MKIRLPFLVSVLVLLAVSCGPAQPQARVFFVEPADGTTVQSPVHVVMGVEGMQVKPAGEIVEGTGHHHLLIDRGGYAEGEAIPNDEQNRHFGGGQTETELELEPGQHTLTLQFANGAHQSYGERLAASITITVE